jgi:hypothetical protein
MPRKRDDSLDAAVLSLSMDGVRPSDIARQLKVTPNRVFAVKAFFYRHGVIFPPIRKGPPTREQAPRLTHLNTELREALAPHAAARGMGTRELALRLLGAIIRDELVDAVLDDGGADA